MLSNLRHRRDGELAEVTQRLKKLIDKLSVHSNAKAPRRKAAYFPRLPHSTRFGGKLVAYFPTRRRGPHYLSNKRSRRRIHQMLCNRRRLVKRFTGPIWSAASYP